MFPQRALPRLSQQLRSPILRRVVQRRGYAVEGGTIDKTGQGLKLAGKEIKLEGPADNAFNRERAAVKAHAAATSGEYTPHIAFLASGALVANLVWQISGVVSRSSTYSSFARRSQSWTRNR